jgi:hypothetical protein
MSIIQGQCILQLTKFINAIFNPIGNRDFDTSIKKNATNLINGSVFYGVLYLLS